MENLFSFHYARPYTKFLTVPLEAAASRALDIGARTYGSVKSILDNNLDRQAVPMRAADGQTIHHPNIRGARYYH